MSLIFAAAVAAQNINSRHGLSTLESPPNGQYATQQLQLSGPTSRSPYPYQNPLMCYFHPEGEYFSPTPGVLKACVDPNRYCDAARD